MDVRCEKSDFRRASAGSQWLVGALQERHAPRFDHFAAPDRPHAFARLGLEANLAWVDVEAVGDTLPHRVDVLGQLRLLGMDHAVEVRNAPTAPRPLPLVARDGVCSSCHSNKQKLPPSEFSNVSDPYLFANYSQRQLFRVDSSGRP